MSQDITPEQMRQVYESVKNWGRWGEEDERGALNLITPAKHRDAATNVAAVIHGEGLVANPGCTARG